MYDVGSVRPVLYPQRRKWLMTDEISQTVAKNPSQKFSSISADLTSDEATENMFQEAIASNDGRSPDIVFCCAGNCVPGFFVNSQMKTLRSQMDTVYWTAANTAHAALKRWLKPVAATDRQEEFVQTHSLPRHLIFTASTICFAPVAGYAPYSAPKAAMRALADTLHQETEVFNAVRRSGKHDAPERDVNVHIIFPMGISSPGYENEQRVKPELTKQLEEADHPQTPAEVARASIKGLERGEFMITTMLIGAVMKASAMGTSGRDHLFWDMALGAISNMVFPAVIWDLNRKAWNWGKANGVPKPVTS